MDDKLKQGLHNEAVLNGLNAKEYLELLKVIDETLDYHVQQSEWYRKGTAPDDYDINGKVNGKGEQR